MCQLFSSLYLDLIQSQNLPLTLRILAQTPTTASSDIHQCYASGFYGIHTTSQCLSSSSHYPSLFAAWIDCPKGVHPCYVRCSLGWGRLFLSSVVRSL
jgi:hypothetical protein